MGSEMCIRDREYIEKDDAAETPDGVLGEGTGDQRVEGSPSVVPAAGTAAPSALSKPDASAKGVFLCDSVAFALSCRETWFSCLGSCVLEQDDNDTGQGG